MSMYMPGQFIKDIIERTNKNTNIIDWSVQNNSVNVKCEMGFEVTQRIGSFLGTLVFPLEKYKLLTELNNINDKKDKEAKKLYQKCLREFECKDSLLYECVMQILDIIKKSNENKRFYYAYTDIENSKNDFAKVMCFIKHLRNSISHCGNNGIMFFPISNCCEGKEITDIIFHDKYNENQQFCMQINIKEELDELRRSISMLFICIEEIDVAGKEEKANDDYLEEVKGLQELFNDENQEKNKWK